MRHEAEVVFTDILKRAGAHAVEHEMGKEEVCGCQLRSHRKDYGSNGREVHDDREAVRSNKDRRLKMR